MEDNAWGSFALGSPRMTLDGSFLKFMNGMRETADLNLERAIKRCISSEQELQKIILDGEKLAAGASKA